MTKNEKLRQAIADYMWAEGCECCRDEDAHAIAAEKIAKMLDVDKYDDGSGYDFYKYRSGD